MRTRLFRRSMRLFAIGLSAIGGVSQAADFASVRVVVRDATQHPVAAADVELRSATSTATLSGVTDARGVLLFRSVALGDYILTVSHAGLSPSTQALTVVFGSTRLAEIQLLSGPTLPQVTVSTTANIALPVSPTPTTLVNSTDIQRTPGANRTNSLAMITGFVPGAYLVHDQLHVRGGHQTTWEIDGVEIPNTNIGSNLGPAIDPQDIDYLEVERGSYQADHGDRTYGIFNIVPRSGLGLDHQAELIVSGGSFGQTDDYASVGDHVGRLDYYLSANGNRSALGLETPVPEIAHDAENGYGVFGNLGFGLAVDDRLRVVVSARHDDYQIPKAPGDSADDVQHESDAFGVASWIHRLTDNAVLSSALLYHYNRADLDAAASDFPISATDRRRSIYAGGQEALQLDLNRNTVRLGVFGFGQHDGEQFDLLFNDGSNPTIRQTTSPSGGLFAGYAEDTFAVTRRWRLMTGVRATHFAAALSESAIDPRFGMTYQLARLNWVLRGFYGRFYQPPPLATLSGPLLAYARSSDLGFIPLHGERDREWQLGVSVPVLGWSIDADYFRTRAENFFDHSTIGNSTAFLPVTIQGALIRGSELTLRSPRFLGFGQVHLAYSNQSADGIGALNGGLTDFAPPSGYFALDHDQRTTLTAGVDANLPLRWRLSMSFYYGSGFANGAGGPSHLPSHSSLDVTVGRAFTDRLYASVTVLNVANEHLLTDNSLTFDGFHYDNPREVYAQLHYRFGY